MAEPAAEATAAVVVVPQALVPVLAASVAKPVATMVVMTAKVGAERTCAVAGRVEMAAKAVCCGGTEVDGGGDVRSADEGGGDGGGGNGARGADIGMAKALAALCGSGGEGGA